MPINQDRIEAVVQAAEAALATIEFTRRAAASIRKSYNQKELTAEEALEAMQKELMTIIDPRHYATVAREAEHLRLTKADNERRKHRAALKRRASGMSIRATNKKASAYDSETGADPLAADFSFVEELTGTSLSIDENPIILATPGTTSIDSLSETEKAKILAQIDEEIAAAEYLEKMPKKD